MRAKLSKLILVLPIIMCCNNSIGATLMIDDKLYSSNEPKESETLEEKSERVGRWITEVLPPQKVQEQVSTALDANENAQEEEKPEEADLIAAAIIEQAPQSVEKVDEVKTKSKTKNKGTRYSYEQLNDAYCSQKNEISELTKKVASLESGILHDISSQMQMLTQIMLINQLAQNSTGPYAMMNAIPTAHTQISQNYSNEYGLRMNSLSNLFSLSSPGAFGTTNNYTYNYNDKAQSPTQFGASFDQNAQTMYDAQSYNTSRLNGQYQLGASPFMFQNMQQTPTTMATNQPAPQFTPQAQMPTQIGMQQVQTNTGPAAQTNTPPTFERVSSSL